MRFALQHALEFTRPYCKRKTIQRATCLFNGFDSTPSMVASSPVEFFGWDWTGCRFAGSLAASPHVAPKSRLNSDGCSNSRFSLPRNPRIATTHSQRANGIAQHDARVLCL